MQQCFTGAKNEIKSIRMVSCFKMLTSVFLNNPFPLVGKLTAAIIENVARGGVVVKALRHKPAGRRFDSRWCHSNFSLT
jgi:hypothetical protein